MPSSVAIEYPNITSYNLHEFSYIQIALYKIIRIYGLIQLKQYVK